MASYNLILGTVLQYSAPQGYPLPLNKQRTLAVGVVPPQATTINVECYADVGCDAHLALFNMPTAMGVPATLMNYGDRNDGLLVTQTDLSGNVTTFQTDSSVTTESTTISLSLPTGTGLLPQPYIFHFWVDNIQGSSADSVSRDSGTPVADNPRIPGSAYIARAYIE